MAKRILIVEDELAIAQAIHDGLQDEGFPSEIADSGEAAAALELSRFALVLLDIRLPGMDGYELCRLIRQRGHKMPVIFVSARDDVVDRILGLEMGADDYIVKPFSFRELLSRIKAQLRRAYGTLAAETDKVRDSRSDTSLSTRDPCASTRTTAMSTSLPSNTVCCSSSSSIPDRSCPVIRSLNMSGVMSGVWMTRAG